MSTLSFNVDIDAKEPQLTRIVIDANKIKNFLISQI